jgi:uncharacterized protein YdiU (UPF0061 family)
MWNLARLADCLIPLVSSNETEAIEQLNHELSLLPQKFQNELNVIMAKKFGLKDSVAVDEILRAWFDYLQKEKLDFTQSFRNLSELAISGENLFYPDTDLFRKFESLWRPGLLHAEGLKKKMDAVNPFFIPRNHQIEKAINSALLGNYSLFNQLNDVLSTPFTERSEFIEFSRPPMIDEKIKNTFCGT